MQRISQVWPGWEVEEFIGQGSYGRVYRASHTEGGHTSQAAVKVIDIPHDETEVAALRSMSMDAHSIRSYFEETAQKVISEVAVMDSLKGAPNVVSIEDYHLLEREDGVGWTVLIRMELLEALPKSLERVGALSPAEAARVGTDVCRALAACHGAGVIHRDVKPENVFVSRYDEYKLGDFGLSRRLDEGSRSTKSQAGSGPYMAPEVLSGHYDASVDTYSLGVMLYRWLNGGKPPFVGANETPTRALLEDAQARRLAGERPPLPGGAGVDSALAGIVRKACEPDPPQRWPTADEFEAALQDWIGGRTVDDEAADEPTPAQPAVSPSPARDDPFSTLAGVADAERRRREQEAAEAKAKERDATPTPPETKQTTTATNAQQGAKKEATKPGPQDVRGSVEQIAARQLLAAVGGTSNVASAAANASDAANATRLRLDIRDASKVAMASVNEVLFVNSSEYVVPGRLQVTFHGNSTGRDVLKELKKQGVRGGSFYAPSESSGGTNEKPKPIGKKPNGTKAPSSVTTKDGQAKDTDKGSSGTAGGCLFAILGTALYLLIIRSINDTYGEPQMAVALIETFAVFVLPFILFGFGAELFGTGSSKSDVSATSAQAKLPTPARTATPATPASPMPSSTTTPTQINAEAGKGIIASPMTGNAAPLSAAPAEVAAYGSTGKGAVIFPANGCCYSPVNGTVTKLYRNLVRLVSDDGIEILIHIGCDPVSASWKDSPSFKAKVGAKDHVEAGQLLIEADLAAIEAAGKTTATMVIVTNASDYSSFGYVFDPVEAGEKLMRVG